MNVKYLTVIGVIVVFSGFMVYFFGFRVLDREIDTSDTVLRTGVHDCQNMLSGAVKPMKDFDMFIDEEYLEVTITSQEEWDEDRIPLGVLERQGEGYTCYPAPMEYDYSDGNESALHIQPAVTRVQWNCELEYEEYTYIAKNDISGKETAEREGFECNKEECFSDVGEFDTIWLCAK